MTPPVKQDLKVDDSFVEKRDVYDEWLRKMIRRRENLKHFTFITLNYDCLLERAICRMFFTPDEKEGQCLCTHIHYPFIGGPTTGVEVLKLQGSIPWIGILDGDGGSSPISIDAEGRSTYKDREVVPTCIGRTDDRDPNEVIMATYAQGKPPQANSIIFPDIRRKAINRISEARKVEILGVHLPPHGEDDPSLWELFHAMAGQEVDFVNPCEEENDLAKAQFCFNVIPKSFREFVDSQL